MRMPLVFLDGPWKMAMGLRALEPAEWLWIDQDYATETAERRSLMATKPELVLACLPGAEAACRELLDTVLAWLERHAPEHVRRDGELWHLPATGETIAPDEPAPLVRLGSLVQEDFCLLSAGADGRYHLVAGNLCFPLHWNLPQKLGQPMAMIHQPVPGFDQRLEVPVDRFFSNLEPERPVWRANWGLTSKYGLHLPDRSDRLSDLAADEVGERLYLRVERQTLRRLPLSRHVVFGIRSMRCRLDEFLAQPPVLRAMALRIREMPEAMLGYKGLLAIREPVLAWLDEAVRRGKQAAA